MRNQFTIGGHTYELVPFLEEGESSVKGHVMVERAHALNVECWPGETFFNLDHQEDIPTDLRDKVYIVFVDWRSLVNESRIAFIKWSKERGRWVRSWSSVHFLWGKRARFLRRLT